MYLNKLKKGTDIPFITNVNKKNIKFLETELKTDSIYYLIRENVKTIPLLTLVNVILSDYRYYLLSKKYHDTLWLTGSDFENCISTFNIDTLTNNRYLKFALLFNECDAKELEVPLHLPENSPIYERNKSMIELLKRVLMVIKFIQKTLQILY